MDGPRHDVEFMEFKVVGVPGSCDGEALASATVPMEEEYLPEWLEPDDGGGNAHPFADALFILRPGDYLACAVPLTAAGVPSEHCAETSGEATVEPEVTTEIFLVSQCLGDPTGALDVVALLNDPPHVNDLSIDPSKFITSCEEATVTADVSDPNGDEISYAWEITAPTPCPAGTTLTSLGNSAVFVPVGSGDYQITLTAADAHGGTATLSFPVHVSHETCGLSGETGAAWECVATPPSRGLQAWVPSGEAYMYAGTGGSFARYDVASNSWTTLASPPVALAFWGSPALSLGDLWELRASDIVRYDVDTDSWTIVRSDLHGGDDQAMTVTADDSGNLWSYNSSDELVRYDPVTDTVSYFPTGVTSYTYETRLGYDRLTHSIYFGGFAGADLYRFDINTGAITALTPHPEGNLNDIFCSDHSGHIYAAGGFSGTSIWQYDILSDAWTEIPPFPVSHGNNGSCSVHEDGWLYVEDVVSGAGMYRIELYGSLDFM